MATTLYPQQSTNLPHASYSHGTQVAGIEQAAVGWQFSPLLTTRGGVALGGNIGTSVTGPTAGREIGSNVHITAWVSPPIAADVTISSSVLFNVRNYESAMANNMGPQVILSRMRPDGTLSTIVNSESGVESGTSDAPHQWSATPGSGVACVKGDRLVVRILANDAGGNMLGAVAAGFSISFNGPTAGAAGDTYVTLTENVTFETTTPAGTQVFLTETAASGITAGTATEEKEMWTSRGAGSTLATLDSVNGWTAPVLFTDAVGGNTIEWFTRPLAAFTFDGPVLVHSRVAVQIAGGRNAHSFEIAVCNGNGTSPVVWARTVGFGPAAYQDVAEAMYETWLRGNDVAVTTGQRLRFRVYLDDTWQAAINTNDLRIWYGGASGATGDFWLQFTDTLTESSPDATGTIITRILTTGVVTLGGGASAAPVTALPVVSPVQLVGSAATNATGTPVTALPTVIRNQLAGGAGGTVVTALPTVTRNQLTSAVNATASPIVVPVQIRDGWIPSSIPGVVGWWEADRGITHSGGLVSGWANQVGSAHWTNSGADSTKPTIGGRTQNGFPALDFDSDDAMLCVGLTDSPSSRFYWALVQIDAVAVGAMMFGTGANDGNDWRISSSDGGVGQDLVESVIAHHVPSGQTATPTGAPHIFAMEYTPTELKAYLDGVQNGTTLSHSFTFTSGGNGHDMGYRGGSTSYHLDGIVLGLVIVDGGISAANRAALDYYGSTKYALGSFGAPGTSTNRLGGAISVVPVTVLPTTVRNVLTGNVGGVVTTQVVTAFPQQLTSATNATGVVVTALPTVTRNTLAGGAGGTLTTALPTVTRNLLTGTVGASGTPVTTLPTVTRNVLAGGAGGVLSTPVAMVTANVLTPGSNASGTLVSDLVQVFGTPGSASTIAHDATTQGGNASGTSSLTFAHTVGSGSDRLLLVSFGCEETVGSSVTGLTYNGVALTQLATKRTSESAIQWVELWYMVAPPVGTFNVVVTLANDPGSGWTAQATSLFGVAQGAPEAVVTSETSIDSTTYSTAITTLTPGAWVYDVIEGNAGRGDLNPDAGQVKRTYLQTGGSVSDVASSTKYVASAGSTTLGWTCPDTEHRWVQILAAWAPATAVTVVGTNKLDGGISVSPVTDLVRVAGGGAIAFDAASDAGSFANAGNAVGFTHTIGGGANRLLVVGVEIESGVNDPRAVSTVTYNGVAMSWVQTAETDWTSESQQHVELFYLLEAELPTAGAYNIAVILNSSLGANAGISAGAVSVAGVAQGPPEATNSAATLTDGTTFGQGLTTLTANAWIFDIIGGGQAASGALVPGWTADAGQIERVDLTGGATQQAFAMSTKQVAVPGSFVSLGWTSDLVTQNRFAMALAAWAPAATTAKLDGGISAVPVTKAIRVGFDPLSVPDAVLVGWFDPDDASTITQSGGLVSAWANKIAGSPVGNLTSSGGARPVTGAASMAGRNVFSFDGAQWLKSAALGSLFPYGFTYVIVFRKTGADTTFESIPLTVSSGNYGAPLDGYMNGRLAGGGNAYNTAAMSSTPYADIRALTVPTVLTGIVTIPGADPLYSEQVNEGAPSIGVATSGWWNPAAQVLTIASRDDGFTTLRGDVGEVFLYAHTVANPSGPDVSQVRALVTSRWITGAGSTNKLGGGITVTPRPSTVEVRGELWTPASTGAALRSFYDASDLSTLDVDGAGGVGLWRDKSALGLHAFPTGTVAAISGAHTIGGRNALWFNGLGANRVRYDTHIYGAQNVTQPFTVFLVVNVLPGGVAARVFDSSGGGFGRSLMNVVDGGGLAMYAGSFGANFGTETGNAMAIALLFNGASSQGQVDATLYGLVDPGTDGFSNLLIGNDGAYSVEGAFDLGEISVVQGNQLALFPDFVRYAGVKWSIGPAGGSPTTKLGHAVGGMVAPALPVVSPQILTGVAGGTPATGIPVTALPIAVPQTLRGGLTQALVTVLPTITRNVLTAHAGGAPVTRVATVTAALLAGGAGGAVVAVPVTSTRNLLGVNVGGSVISVPVTTVRNVLGAKADVTVAPITTLPVVVRNLLGGGISQMLTTAPVVSVVPSVFAASSRGGVQTVPVVVVMQALGSSALGIPVPVQAIVTRSTLAAGAGGVLATMPVIVVNTVTGAGASATLTTRIVTVFPQTFTVGAGGAPVTVPVLSTRNVLLGGAGGVVSPAFVLVQVNPLSAGGNVTIAVVPVQSIVTMSLLGGGVSTLVQTTTLAGIAQQLLGGAGGVLATAQAPAISNVLGAGSAASGSVVPVPVVVSVQTLAGTVGAAGGLVPVQVVVISNVLTGTGGTSSTGAIATRQAIVAMSTLLAGAGGVPVTRPVPVVAQQLLAGAGGILLTNVIVVTVLPGQATSAAAALSALISASRWNLFDVVIVESTAGFTVGSTHFDPFVLHTAEEGWFAVGSKHSGPVEVAGDDDE